MTFRLMAYCRDCRERHLPLPGMWSANAKIYFPSLVSAEKEKAQQQQEDVQGRFFLKDKLCSLGLADVSLDRFANKNTLWIVPKRSSLTLSLHGLSQIVHHCREMWYKGRFVCLAEFSLFVREIISHRKVSGTACFVSSVDLTSINFNKKSWRSSRLIIFAWVRCISTFQSIELYVYHAIIRPMSLATTVPKS